MPAENARRRAPFRLRYLTLRAASHPGVAPATEGDL